MESVYLNDPNGIKPSKLAHIEVEAPQELEKECINFLCEHLVKARPEQVFFAQNLTTHLAHIVSLVEKVEPNIKQVYISDHEIKWMKELLESIDSQPDATYSNYHKNVPAEHPALDVHVIEFKKLLETVRDINTPSIFFVSHISRLTGEVLDIESLYKLIKAGNPNSLLVVDGAQAIGAYTPIEVNTSCDAYLGLSSKFIGAEPHLGILFSSDSFYAKYIGARENYPKFDPEAHAKDLYSLHENLGNPQYLGDFYSEITSVKDYAIQELGRINPALIYSPSNQASNFLTLDFGSKEANQTFVKRAEEEGIVVSENSGWSIAEPERSLVRVGISVRTTKSDIDKLVEVIQKEAPRN